LKHRKLRRSGGFILRRPGRAGGLVGGGLGGRAVGDPLPRVHPPHRGPGGRAWPGDQGRGLHGTVPAGAGRGGL